MRETLCYKCSSINESFLFLSQYFDEKMATYNYTLAQRSELDILLSFLIENTKWNESFEIHFDLQEKK